MDGERGKARRNRKARRYAGAFFAVVVLGAGLYVFLTAGAVGLGFGQKVSGRVTGVTETRSSGSSPGSTSCYGFVVDNGERITVKVDGGCSHVGESFTTYLPFGFSGRNYDTVYFDRSAARTHAIVAACLAVPIGGFFALMAMFPGGGERAGKSRRERRSWTGEQAAAASSAKEASFRSRGHSYRQVTGRDGEPQHQVVGPYRGHTLEAIGESRWIGYQGTVYGDGGEEAGPPSYRSFLRVSLDIEPSVLFLYTYARADRASQDTKVFESRFDRFYRGTDVLRSATLVCPDPEPTGTGSFDDRFGINCNSDLASRMMTPELCAWIAADPRSADFRIFVYNASVSVCYLGPIVAAPDDIFDANHIFHAADYLIDMAAHVPREVFRLAPATRSATSGA